MRAVVFSGLADSLDVRLDDCLGDIAEPIEQIVADGIPLVLCSSRTRAELGFLQQRLGIRDPFACEGGAAVVIQPRYFPFDVQGSRQAAGCDVVEFGETHAAVLDALRTAAGRLGVRVLEYSDMSVSDVAADRNLPLLHARLAKFREYEELFRVAEPDAAGRLRLLKALRATGIRVTPAGGGYERASVTVDAGPAVKFLCGLYRRAFPGVVLFGVGWSQNHLALLEHVDRPLIVSSSTDAASELLRRLPDARRVIPDALAPLVRRLSGPIELPSRIGERGIREETATSDD